MFAVIRPASGTPANAHSGVGSLRTVEHVTYMDDVEYLLLETQEWRIPLDTLAPYHLMNGVWASGKFNIAGKTFQLLLYPNRTGEVHFAVQNFNDDSYFLSFSVIVKRAIDNTELVHFSVLSDVNKVPLANLGAQGVPLGRTLDFMEQLAAFAHDNTQYVVLCFTFHFALWRALEPQRN